MSAAVMARLIQGAGAMQERRSGRRNPNPRLTAWTWVALRGGRQMQLHHRIAIATVWLSIHPSEMLNGVATYPVVSKSGSSSVADRIAIRVAVRGVACACEPDRI